MVLYIHQLLHDTLVSVEGARRPSRQMWKMRSLLLDASEFTLYSHTIIYLLSPSEGSVQLLTLGQSVDFSFPRCFIYLCPFPFSVPFHAGQMGVQPNIGQG